MDIGLLGRKGAMQSENLHREQCRARICIGTNAEGTLCSYAGAGGGTAGVLQGRVLGTVWVLAGVLQGRVLATVWVLAGHWVLAVQAASSTVCSRASANSPSVFGMSSNQGPAQPQP